MFDAVVGHGPVVTQLQRALEAGTLSHALLLVGPDGVGKTTLGETLAAAALGAGSWPGGLAAHPDHWLEDSESERIGIDRVRGGAGGDLPSLQEFLSLRAYAGGRRVAVIARADRLTEQAANSLLKTVEEPPAGTHIVVATAFPERLPATIASRCQAYSCSPVPAPEVRAWLQGRGVSPDLAATAGALCGGRPGRALRLATEPGALQAEVAAIDAFLAIAGGGTAGALRAAQALAPGPGAEGRERALQQLSAWTGFVRDVACLATGAAELPVWDAYRQAQERWAEALPVDRLTEILGRLITAADQLAQYATPRLTYDTLFLDIFARPPAPPLVAPGERGALPDGPVGEAARRPASPSRKPRPSRGRG